MDESVAQSGGADSEAPVELRWQETEEAHYGVYGETVTIHEAVVVVHNNQEQETSFNPVFVWMKQIIEPPII